MKSKKLEKLYRLLVELWTLRLATWICFLGLLVGSQSQKNTKFQTSFKLYCKYPFNFIKTIEPKLKMWCGLEGPSFWHSNHPKFRLFWFLIHCQSHDNPKIFIYIENFSYCFSNLVGSHHVKYAGHKDAFCSGRSSDSNSMFHVSTGRIFQWFWNVL